GYTFKATLKDHDFASAEGTLSAVGNIKCGSKKPDLSKRTMRRIFTDLLVEFLTQFFIYRHMNADAQNGNIIPTDGGVTAVIDWANTAHFKWSNLIAPARLSVGLFMGRYRMAARAMIAMSNKASVKGAERKKLEE